MCFKLLLWVGVLVIKHLICLTLFSTMFGILWLRFKIIVLNRLGINFLLYKIRKEVGSLTQRYPFYIVVRNSDCQLCYLLHLAEASDWNFSHCGQLPSIKTNKIECQGQMASQLMPTWPQGTCFSVFSFGLDTSTIAFWADVGVCFVVWKFGRKIPNTRCGLKY